MDDLHDGSYLFRYRLYESVENLHLRIQFGNEEIEHTVKGHLYSDGCYCPESNRTRWSEALECPSVGSSAQLRQDFQIFDQIDMKQVIQKAKDKYFQHQQSYALCHYALKNNKVGAGEELSKEQWIALSFWWIDPSKMSWWTRRLSHILGRSSSVAVSKGSATYETLVDKHAGLV